MVFSIQGLNKFSTLDVKDYVELLNLTGAYEITVFKVKKDDWIENKKLNETDLHKEGINLIALKRKDDTFIGSPQPDTTIKEGDDLIIYGREKALKNLEQRKEDVSGEADHQKAMKDQEKEVEKQDKKEES